MNKPKHTPGLWTVQNVSNRWAVGSTNAPGWIIAEYTRRPGERISLTEANAERIVACVNACEGIDPEAVPRMLAALKLAQNGIVPELRLTRNLVKRAITLATGGKG